ncbi:hypothetical protein LWI28_026833 [Acer negundo]|uniref:Retrotransposon gag domain-containing protein n=1 Tax=Acer negundo TaxID=4023 RepID=A0AAD5NFH1_ACENE|nr:hypothetical protein LWI28_026833 [Acer negundo]
MKLKLKLDDKFLPIDYKQSLYSKFHHLRQKNEQSVADYTKEFYKYLNRVNSRETDGQLVRRYLSGLKHSIYHECSLHRLNSLEEAFQMALKAEEKLKRMLSKRFSNAISGTSKEGQRSSKVPSQKVTGVSKNQMSTSCGKVQKQGGTTCFRCGLEGHIAYEYPKRGQETCVNLI